MPIARPTYDPTGNWSNYQTKANGATDLAQSRTHNPVNEITDITTSVGTVWPDPVQDAAGNMTSMPQPADLANSFTCTYDAWNRLVKLEDGATTVAEYEYDGLNRRTLKVTSPSGPPITR